MKQESKQKKNAETSEDEAKENNSRIGKLEVGHSEAQETTEDIMQLNE